MKTETPTGQPREIFFQEYMGADNPDTLRKILADSSMGNFGADAAQPWGECAGVIAAEWEFRATLALLSEFGFSVDPNAGRGMPRLWSSRTYVSEDDILSLVDALVQRNANLNPVGLTPLHLAAQRGHERVVERLLKAGANPVADAYGNNFQPLHATLFHRDVWTSASRRIAELLIERGADVHARWGYFPTSPLAHAALGNQVEVAWFLLGHGANVNDSDADGDTPLHRVTARLNRVPEGGGVPVARVVEMITLLLDAGANPNVTNRYGVAPLLAAIPYPTHRDVCRVLIARGADVNAIDSSGYTPLARVVGQGDESFVRELLTLRSDPLIGLKDHSAIESAVYWGNEPILKVLLAAIPAMSLKPMNDVLLHSAVHKDAAGCVALMAPFGVRPGTVFPHGKISPLHAAARYGAVQVLEMCLGAGSVPNVCDRLGRTPLYMAARYNRPDAVAILLRYGGDATIADKDGVTPLQIAQQKNKKHAVAALTMATPQPNP